ncbi:DUF6541 family protein [Arthrobacter sulfonylureivorans]|uniref:Arabinofuranosyltransferase AftA N-terminal domain-containing protein n=1 Tax=Arthrobacter sulfonylureivorans TaxID=2486855 RepID=A0ABY3WBT1_9MICC|nr:DUF6541 family protein [Arthrobacter sulfonylureivorans]UNK47466.1 hypothetical protein MNQ99_09135 [Arthrobacter sulfonylureivorans]
MALLIVFYVPGYLGLRGLRLPSLPAAVLAPAAGAAFAAAGTMFCLISGLQWNGISAAIVAALCIAVCVLLGRLIAAPSDPPNSPISRFFKLLVAGSLVAAATIIGAVQVGSMGELDRVAQAWDPTYHVNVLQWIKDNGQASPWSIWPIFGGAPPSFYPSGWHAMVALVPGSVVVSGNLSVLIIGCLVWPTSMCLLSRALFPNKPVVWIATPIVAASLLAFPFVQMGRSGQWPNSFATALLPAILALGIEMQFRSRVRWTADAVLPGRHMTHRTIADRRGTIARLVSLMIVTAGAVWIHPSALFALLALGGLYMVRFSVLWCRGIWLRNQMQGVLLTSSLIAASVMTAIVLVNSDILAGVIGYPRRAIAGWEDALTWVVFDLPRPPDHEDATADSYGIVVGVLMIIGTALALLMPRARPAVGGMAISVLLFVFAAGPEGPFRWLSGIWYKDPPRLAPLVLIFGCVFAAFALESVLHRILRSFRPIRRRERLLQPMTAAVCIGVLAITFVASSSFRYEFRVTAAGAPYSTTPGASGRGLVGAEQEFIKSFGPLLPEGAIVIGDPFNGLPYIYSLTGHQVVYFQMVMTSGSADKHYLRHHFHDINKDPKVCDALNRLGATHLYDDQLIRAHQSNGSLKWPGFKDIDFSHGFRQISSQGSTALYEITACR